MYVLPPRATWHSTECLALFQIARDCPEGREPVEEDNWGEVQEDAWGNVPLPADGDQN
jgi:hypothetical protein